MEKPQHGWGAFTCMVILFISFVSFSSCIAAEFKKTKEKDMKLDGKLCYLPRSPAFGLGIVATICLLTVQIIGNLVIIMQFRSREKKTGEDDRKRRAAISLVALSWISFGFTVLLLGVATSMNEMQAYGDGWLDGECYIVKDGVYIGSAALILTTIGFILGSIFVINTGLLQKQVEQGRKVYAVSVLR